MADHDKPQGASHADTRAEFIILRVGQALGATNKEKLKKSFESEDNKQHIDSFLSDHNVSDILWVASSGSDNVALSCGQIPPIDKFKKKGVVVLKLTTQPLTQENIQKEIALVEMTYQILDHLYCVFNEIMSPVMQNPANQQGWTDLISKDLMEKFNNYVAQVYVLMGQIKGKTMLPLPSNKLTQNDSIPDKDKAHVFEGSIITWTKQIKNVLKLEPEQLLKSENHPGPLTEIQFWNNKMQNLNLIDSQLQSVEVKNILRFLEGNKSTYTNPFSKLQKDVSKARIEANDNYRFLFTLKELFQKLNDSQPGDFHQLHELFIPIMHTILLIWKKSRFYNTPSRLVVLIREICNAIIAKAQLFVDKDTIFALIDSRETPEACDKLQVTLDICSKFKDAYFEYKAKAEGGWKLTSNALFVRLDSFLERCQDILHLTNTIVQFTKLEKIELGGTKGKTLTESIQQIFREFEEAVAAFTSVKYDIMDISEKKFDDDFYEFRSKIKELERRLASVITQGFDDNDTIYGRFKLLENFEGLLTRPIIADELEKKHIVLLEMYKQDLKTVQSIFLEGKQYVDNMHENAPLFLNMPPIAGALTWCKSLHDRIQEPIDKLAQLGQGITEREEYKDVQKLYASITKSIKDYEDQKKLSWEKEVEQSSKDKLGQFLLFKDENDLIKVNFDPSLVRLLKEVKYFKMLKLEVPNTARSIFENAETYRTQIVSLDMIVDNYNHIKTCLLPVEEPLVKVKIQEMEEEIKPATEKIKWESKEEINKFITKAKQTVDTLYETVNKMKDSLQKINASLNKFNVKFIERKSRPMSPDDYDQYLRAIFANKLGQVKENGGAIHKLLKEVLDAVKADKKQNAWINYNYYINCIVIDGISTAIQTALQNLNEQINPVHIKKNEIPPMFDIRLELGEPGIQYEPDIAENPHVNITVRNTIRNWINEFFNMAFIINRLDTSTPGDFLLEIRNFFEVKQCLSQITVNLEFIETECQNFKQKFDTYSYLWTEDEQKSFLRFLDENEPKVEENNNNNEEDEEKQDTSKQNPLLKGCRANIPNLDLFDDKIIHLKSIQQEIQKIKSSEDIYWLRINLQPMKSALDNRVTRWIRVYTDFLVNQFKTTLKNLQDFVEKTKDGIKKNPADEENKNNKQLLMNVMKVISDVKDVEPKREAIIQRMKEMLNKLKKHNVPVTEKGGEDPLQAIDNANSNFLETYGRVFKLKADILPLQSEETQNIKKELDVFQKEVEVFRKNFLATLPFSYSESMTIKEINNSYVVIMEFYDKLVAIESKAHEYNNLEKLFELQKSNYKQLKDCSNDLKNLKTMWDSIALVNYQYNDWKLKPWRQIKADILLDFNKTLATQLKTLPKEIRNFKGYNVIVDKVKNMGTVLPLVSALHSEFMEDRHWQTLKMQTNKSFDHNSLSFTFEEILGLNLYKYENFVNEIVDVAQKEAKIEKKLKAIEQWWTKQIFEFTEYKETKIFASLDNMMEVLDQHSLDLMGMKSQGKYVEFFYDRVEDWREKLGRVDVVVNEWLKVQKNWKILYNIFLASEDIRMQLPEDTKVFEGVDKEFRDLMSEVSLNPGVVESCTPEKKEVLQGWSQAIRKCEKALNDYLEQKKKSFPRFYFLSNQSLLTILSNGQNAPKVCEYLGDCFDGLKTIQFEPPANPNETAKIGVAMISKDDEIVPFSSKFVCEGAVENWLLNLEFRMRDTLQEILEHAKGTADLWDSGEKPREEWLDLYNAQLALLTTTIVWTEDVGRAFEDLAGGSETAMKDCLKLIETRLENLIKKVRTDLHILERWKAINVITIDVHSRDVVEKFIIQKISEQESFAWLSQLKFYWENKPDSDMHLRQNLRFPWEKDKEKSKCIVKIVDWFRFYSYEYIGNALRLVVTPLTDRCYITLTQALNLTMGGAPAGPAGTGKTETTKDLGRAIGIPVMVFNCSDQMNKDSMAQIFMGLSQSGAWGCFDEFNRISIEVLSVVSTQVKCVLDALKEKKTKFAFVEEGEINLIDTVGFFITMNPGYAGRTELPENLKALFRSCAMVTPDLALICENMLMSEGFTQARNLSRKFVSLYMLSRELLSKQKHYDWGLRAVKSVLRQAGKLKRADPDMPEDPLLMRALRDFNMPKIVTDDKIIFIKLIEDLFPNLNPPAKLNPELKKVVQDTTKKDMGLIQEELFVTKVVQLAEILEVRHCVFVIGPPGSGKTAVWKTLTKTYCNIQQDCEYDTLNPKAITSDELFGAYTKTKEWKNGVIAVIMKNQVKNEEKYKSTHAHKWTVLDGDIDPEWIESLNTVMDDNKVLTLVSNDRIFLTNQMRLIFEISNLKNATPATVSRAGVLFINETDIGWMPFMNSWLERSQINILKQQKENANMPEYPDIDDIAKSIFYRCFESYYEQNPEVHDKNRIRHICPMVDIAAVQTICTILDCLLLDNKDKLKAMKDQNREDDLKVVYEAFFIFAGLWAIGGPIGGGQDDQKDMKEFSQIWKAISKIKFPEQQIAYDYYYDINELKWVTWQAEPYLPSDNATLFSKIYVSTIHTTRLAKQIEIHLKRRKPILLIGSAGTGKTAVIKDYLYNQTKPDQVSHKTINFSSFTDSLALQKNIESMVEKKNGRNYGSATNKVLICFIDDLNMPYVDKYGTQSPIQLLRLIIDYGTIFNRDQLEEKKFLQDLLFFACLNQKSGSFTVDLRLQRNFSVFTMYTPSQDIIKTIFGSILNAHLATIDDKNQKMSPKIIDATQYVFDKVLKNTTAFAPSAKRFHYQFNFRELAKVVEGLCRSTQNQYKDSTINIVKLWCHEMKRTFEDRFITTEHNEIFKKYVAESLVKNIGEFPESDNPMQEPLIFTQFVSAHYGQDLQYTQTDIPKLKKVLTEKLEEYNEVKAQMNLVLFQQAMEHVCRISRILDMPGNNALLVGVGGSGKQSLCRLSTFICSFDIDQLVVTSNFSMNDLRNNLQEIYKKIAKPNAIPRVFMLTDSQIKEEQFLIPINDMLNSGWIFDLFTKEDMDALVGGVRNEAKGEGVDINNIQSLTTFFLDKIRKNLKVVLCFSPVGDTMRVRSRKFPAIINNTSIDWFHPWPKDALIDVAFRFIEDLEFPTEQIRQAVSLNMAEVHTSIDVANEKFLKLERRHNYTTPKSFLELIDFYKKLLNEKRDFIQKQIQRYEMGLNILAVTQNKVEGLQEELKVKMVEVNKQREETDILIEKVGRESAIAEVEQTNANQEEEKTNIAAAEAEKISNTAEAALAQALPALNSAKDAVNCLKKAHVTEMKSLANPPIGVLVVARVVLILMNQGISLNDADEKVWKKAQGVMNNPVQFIEKIALFDGENIEQNLLDNANKIIQDPSKKFSEKEMASQSFAASKLAAWAVNIVIFNKIFKEVKPLQEAKQAAMELLDQKNKELAIVKAKVAELNAKVNTLKRQLEEAETRKQAVEQDAARCLARLSAAENLVNGLAGENKRWTQNVKFLKENIKSMIGDSLLASSFVSYIGAFSAKLRLNLWKNIWLPDIISKGIPMTDKIEPLMILTTEAVKSKWKNEGLPADPMSLENAAIISACSRWPLMIDPQLQGSTWIRGKQGENLTSISMNQAKWLSQLINAISAGRAVLIEGIQEEIDATLDPLLQRAIKKNGNSYQLDLGGDPIDYDINFKLFLMTKLINPHFRPEIAAQCTIINFIVTESGLEEQFIAMVVNIERNELEMKKQELVKKQNEYSVTLDKLESDLLQSLSEADPSTILDNTELIQNLDKTKKTTIEIQEQQQQAKITEAEINMERENYRVVAAEGAMLYFLVISLSVVDHMYQYSLESFITFFFKAINRTTIKDETRIPNLILNVRYTIYQWIARGLFEKHKLIFLTLIVFRLMQKKIIEVAFDHSEMDFLIKCPSKPGVAPNLLEWLPNNAWDAIQGLICLEEFRPFAQNMEKDAPNRFKDWYNELAPEEQKLPLDWKKLDAMPFKKLLVLRCLRPDRMTVSITNFIRQVLPQGDLFVEMDSKFAFADILEQVIMDDSDPTIPVFFILSPGSDPVKEVERIAKKNKIEPGKSFFNIALGQGQDEIARRRIEEGNKEGHWVMLQNIHLMPRWLIELEKILDSYSGEGGGGNSNFRLFFSAEPSGGIPIGILDRSIKLTNEPPAGLKANMKRAWTFFSKEEIEDKDPKAKSILFALCFFHSTLIERRRFGAKGWNMSYPFNMGDLRDSYLVMTRYMDQNAGGKVPFNDLIYIFGEIMYGGHIVDDWDRRLCSNYLFNMMHEGLFDEYELFPFIEGKGISFKVPGQNPYEKYIEHIDQSLKQETPLAYGLHPNAEIGFRTEQCRVLFNLLLELTPKDTGGDEKGDTVKSSNEIAADYIKQLLEDMELKSKIFPIEDIKQKVADREKQTPYQNIFFQELEYMNFLLVEMVKDLEEIQQGLAGLLTVSENMEQIIEGMALNRVPTGWQKLAYPSKRGLASWLQNLFQRIDQLNFFKDDPNIVPKVVMISRLFNPQSFLTAIMQDVSRSAKACELNKLYIQTEITKRQMEEIESNAKEGAYVYGFVLEGARWDIQLGCLEESKPKEMFCVLPVVYCKAQQLPPEGKEDKSLYLCPAYKTEDRGNTYVFTAQLKTKQPPRKWILGGVAIIMDVEGVSDEVKKDKDKDKK